MKKFLSVLIVLAMLFTLAACGAQETDSKVESQETESQESETQESESQESEPQESEPQKIELGTSGYSILSEKSYMEGEITEEDTDEAQVAYYYSDDTLVDFDVYQWAKATDETLDIIAEDEAVEYDSTVEEADFNGNRVLFYKAVEEHDDVEYDTVSYLMEDGDMIVELVFWLDGENAQAEVDAMMATLTLEKSAEQAEGVIALGTSAYTIAPEKSYKEGEITEEDTDETQVAYYYSDDTLVDFDVYQWAKATDETLDAAAADEAEEYESTVEEADFNGNRVLFYKAVEEHDDVEYDTVSYLMEDGDVIVELVFWLDGENAQAEVDAIMATLTK